MKPALIALLIVGFASGCATLQDVAKHLNAHNAGGKNGAAAKPFVNTLGMRFVPIPDTDVYFCVWETRLKDYAVYASTEGGAEPTRADLLSNGLHPVSGISWNDAWAFCTWLTKKEISEGRIKVGQRYRLPTDAEWSVAAGLANEKGESPKGKSMGIKVYPWGKEWPPPKEIGNYSHVLKVDTFNNASAVASFKASKFGLYDMSGNVWEWCEDWYDPEVEKTRVLRGGSWATDTPNVLLWSFRQHYAPDYHRPGFRCVLTK